MNMRRETMDKIVNDHFMYEASADLEGVVGTYTDDPEHQVMGGPDGPLRAEPVMKLYGDDFIVDESILIGQVVDGRPFNLSGKSGHARMRLPHVFQLRDGRIAKERVWFDFADMKRQLR